MCLNRNYGFIRLSWNTTPSWLLSTWISPRLIVAFTFNNLSQYLNRRQASYFVSPCPLLLETNVAQRPFHEQNHCEPLFDLRPRREFWVKERPPFSFLYFQHSMPLVPPLSNLLFVALSSLHIARLKRRRHWWPHASHFFSPAISCHF